MVRGLVPVASLRPSTVRALCQGIGPWPLQAVGPWEGEGTQGLPPTQSRHPPPAPAQTQSPCFVNPNEGLAVIVLLLLSTSSANALCKTLPEGGSRSPGLGVRSWPPSAMGSPIDLDQSTPHPNPGLYPPSISDWCPAAVQAQAGSPSQASDLAQVALTQEPSISSSVKWVGVKICWGYRGRAWLTAGLADLSKHGSPRR